jgi:enamine deaminase RidA (YjgF/YER057c/UK114 family)
MDIYERLKELNIQLPPAPPPGGMYTPAKIFGSNLVYTSGVGSTDASGEEPYLGKLGADLTVEQGQDAARLATINLLSVLNAELGDLNRIKSIVKQLGFIASTPDFYQQPAVLNGSTKLLIQAFGDVVGRPARSAIAVNVLPDNIPIEIELLVELKD